MKIYLVGGAIRDKLLDLPVKEKDWVVVGSTPDEMKTKGFKQVGKDFPVFIHPKTGEEYALARTERKSGHGYTGFEFDTNPNVTLKEDLERRDLTINAIAQDEDGTLIDPFNGQEDIKNKKLRHVSDAFSEDPLRVLRIARFKVNLEDFQIVPKTMDKIKEIINSGELSYLTGERVWLEFFKAHNPSYFAAMLNELQIYDLLPGYSGKSEGLCTSNKLHAIAYFIHNEITEIDKFCEKLRVPNEYKDLAMILNSCKERIEEFEFTHGHDTLIEIIKMLDIRKEERLNNFFEIISINENKKEFFKSLIIKIKNFKLKDEDQKKSNQEIQKIIESSHLEIVQKHINEYLDSK